ncbi:MAG: electron transfer flavoprotein subunit alpha/FixB family protein [Acidimicrobiales bacterium]
MASDVVVVVEHDGGAIADGTFELLGKGREIADAWGGRLVAALFGHPELADTLGAADVVRWADSPELGGYNPEAWEALALRVVESVDARLVLIGTSTVGMDLGSSLAALWNAAPLSYVVNLTAEGDKLLATSQIYAGKLLADLSVTAPRIVATHIGGLLPAEAGKKDGSPVRERIDPGVVGSLRSEFKDRRVPDAGGVDITAAPMLVSVGRGIAGQDNLELAQEVADALGVPLSASRPVIDQGWLPKPHQVGKSGKKVKPKAYLAFGISGAPEHLEGMRNSELIIACNTDPNAPIFDVAHYGTTVDLFDLLPELAERLGD